MKLNLYKTIIISTLIATLGCTNAFAQTNGFGEGQGRTDTINVNDYSTSSWERFSFSYEFSSGTNYKEELGRPTLTDIIPRNPETENIRRNKDVAFVPPAYGIFSGELDTERSNPYITIKNYEYAKTDTNILDSKTYDTLSMGVNGAKEDISLPKINEIPTSSTSNNVTTSYSQNTVLTEPLLYEDGSIGTISIPKLKLSVKVFEGEYLDNLKKGVGHFSFTSSWDGLVGLAGHNGGSAGYFENIKDLSNGDEILYKTKYGERTYVVSSKQIITDTDYSTLGYSTENQLNLITCVKNSPNERLSLIATEK